MQKRILIFLIFITSVSLARSQDYRNYTCYRTPVPLNVNGVIDEPSWADAEWSEEFVDITGDPKLRPPLHTRIKMLWDENYLYLAAELQEPHVWASLRVRDTVIFHDNDFELFIDPEGNGINYYEIEINALGTVWDLMLTKAYRMGGKPLTGWDLTGLRSGISIKGSLNDPLSPDTSWTVEMALPIGELMKGKDPRKRPDDGVQWKLNFSRVEWETIADGPSYRKKSDPVTGKRLPEQNWVWAPMGEINMHIPGRWGWLEFSTENIKAGTLFPDRSVHPDPSPAEGAGHGRNPAGDEPDRHGFMVWAWTGGYEKLSDVQLDSLLNLMKTRGISGILTGASPASLRRMVPVAHRYGIRVQKWYVAMMNNNPDLIRDHADWFVINREGKSSVTNPAYVGYYRFLCPSNPEVRRYLNASIQQYIDIEGLDGIHLDYIRFPDVILPEALWSKYGIVQDQEYPPYDYCYCSHCTGQFRAKYGREPYDRDHSGEDPDWRFFRYGQVTSLVGELAALCHSSGKKLSAAVFPGPSAARRIVRQDWGRWELDGMMPMLYHSFYFGSLDWIRQQTEEGVDTLKKSRSSDKVMTTAPDPVPLFSGLYVPTLTPRELLTAVRKSAAGGANGVVLFNYEAMTQQHWKALGEFLNP